MNIRLISTKLMNTWKNALVDVQENVHYSYDYTQEVGRAFQKYSLSLVNLDPALW